MPVLDGAAGHVVIAEFEVEASRFDHFIALARDFAGECLAQEPGCRSFEVVCLDAPPHGVLFFEAYEDAAAFAVHGRSAHLARFKAAFAALIVREQPLRQDSWRGSAARPGGSGRSQALGVHVASAKAQPAD